MKEGSLTEAKTDMKLTILYYYISPCTLKIPFVVICSHIWIHRATFLQV